MATENQMISSWHQQITRKTVKSGDTEKLSKPRVLCSNNAICNSAQVNLPVKKNTPAKTSNIRTKVLPKGSLRVVDANTPKKTPPAGNDKKVSSINTPTNGENNKENIDPNAQALASLSLKSNSPKSSPKLKRDPKSRLKRL